ncbi:pyridoxamine 5'-phosphate oxidase family protein [Streptomyces sp. M10(2022)]
MTVQPIAAAPTRYGEPLVECRARGHRAGPPLGGSSSVGNVGNVGNVGDVLAQAVPLRSADELREILGIPHPIVIDKVHDRLTEQDLDLLGRARFCALSTSDADGNCDVSPRGDATGFTHVLDEGTLAFPDRPGNRRGDSFLNILANPMSACSTSYPAPWRCCASTAGRASSRTPRSSTP